MIGAAGAPVADRPPRRRKRSSAKARLAMAERGTARPATASMAAGPPPNGVRPASARKPPSSGDASADCMAW